MTEAEKKYRLVYYDVTDKQYKIKECATWEDVKTWQIGNPDARFIEFFASVGPDQVLYSTREEAIAKSKNPGLVKPKFPKDLPQAAREVLYKL